jgi:hypothetical protein
MCIDGMNYKTIQWGTLSSLAIYDYILMANIQCFEHSVAFLAITACRHCMKNKLSSSNELHTCYDTSLYRTGKNNFKIWCFRLVYK